MINKELLNKQMESLNEVPVEKDALTLAATNIVRVCPECIELTHNNRINPDKNKKSDICLCDTHHAIHTYIIGRRIENKNKMEELTHEKKKIFVRRR